jgi:hypothetical protein
MNIGRFLFRFVILLAVCSPFSGSVCLGQEVKVRLYTASSEAPWDESIPLILEIQNKTNKKQTVGLNPSFEREEIIPKGVKMLPQLAETFGAKPDGHLYVLVKCLVPLGKGARVRTGNPGPQVTDYLEIKPGEAAFYKIDLLPGLLAESDCLLEAIIQSGEKEVARSNSVKVKGLKEKDAGAPEQGLPPK